MYKHLLVLLLIFGLFIGGCTLNSNPTDENQGLDDAGTNILNEDLQDFGDLEAELNNIDGVDLDQLDF